jgi:dephospho-CoA kinase
MNKKTPEKQKIIFACVGSNGSGKDTVVDYILATYKLERISISDMVRAKATELSLPHTRENLNRISKDLIECYGNDYFAKLAIAEINNNSSNYIAVPDIRSPQDVKTFRDAFGNSFILTAVVVSDDRMRYERLIARGTDRDPKSWSEFLSNEQREEKIFQINTTVLLADFKILNDYNLSKLRENTDLIATNLNLPPK